MARAGVGRGLGWERRVIMQPEGGVVVVGGGQKEGEEVAGARVCVCFFFFFASLHRTMEASDTFGVSSEKATAVRIRTHTRTHTPVRSSHQDMAGQAHPRLLARPLARWVESVRTGSAASPPRHNLLTPK